MTDRATPADDAALWTSDEITRLVSESGDAAETLSNLVRLIQQRFGTDVCSVYLLEPDRSTLVLAATIGLRPESVGKIRMRLTEGLVGLVGEQMQPQVIEHATTHPRFKYFREAGEDPYQSFLGVPLVDRGLLQGVLVVQTLAPRAFGPDAVRQLEAAGLQLAPVVSEARTLGLFVAPSHQRLCALAQNLWWSWDDDTTALFRELDPVLWRQLAHNPVALLQRIDIDDLQERANQLVLHSRINYAVPPDAGVPVVHARPGACQHAGVLWARPVAYFSAEFGLHESIPIYSGGLGILAGDHIKGASDLGVPLVGIGLYYHQAYFRQRLDIDGYQQEDYIDVDRRLLPMQPATDRVRQAGGRDHRHALGLHRGARVEAGGGPQHAAAARSDVEGNRPEDRQLTARLYGGDDWMRIRQELLLGVGGVRALKALGISPSVAHLNEGHSAFAALELVRDRMVDRRHRRRGRHPPRRAADRLHDAHAGAGRPRPVHAGVDRGAPRARCATRSACRPTRCWRWAARIPPITARRSA